MSSNSSSSTGSPIAPWTLGVCSWSLQVSSIPELKRLLEQLGIDVVQIACGDPHHASWEEGEAFPATARASGITMTGAMLGFPGEDYTTPQSIRETGGFGNPQWRAERMERLAWGLDRTLALGLHDLTLHAGFIPEVGDPQRSAMLDTLAQAADLAARKGVTLAFETGQETATLLRQTLDELQSPNVKVNFDPANMLLYDMGDPIQAVAVLGPDIRSVHVKDARRPRQRRELGVRKFRWARVKSASRAFWRRSVQSATAGRWSSNARWGIRRSGSGMWPTASPPCVNASHRRAKNPAGLKPSGKD
jgi:L-ribulose-5-phosphate 3-epimerase